MFFQFFLLAVIMSFISGRLIGTKLIFSNKQVQPL